MSRRLTAQPVHSSDTAKRSGGSVYLTATDSGEHTIVWFLHHPWLAWYRGLAVSPSPMPEDYSTRWRMPSTHLCRRTFAKLLRHEKAECAISAVVDVQNALDVHGEQLFRSLKTFTLDRTETFGRYWDANSGHVFQSANINRFNYFHHILTSATT